MNTGTAASVRRSSERRLKNGMRRSFRSLIGARVTRSVFGNIFNIVFLTILAVFMLIPMLYVVNNAFKPLDELYLYPPKIFVQNPTVDNLRSLLSAMNNSWVPITRHLFNTLLVTIAGTAGHVILASMAAYVLEKHDFYGRRLFFNMVVISLLFSSTVTSIPNFVIMSKIGLVDNYFALIIPAFGSSLGLFLMKQFMETVPNPMLEAAKIDGAGELRIFFKIVMPSVKPAWLTLIIFSFQGLWNSTGGVLIRSEELKPLPYALNQIVSGGYARAGAAAAVSLVLMIVPIIVFIVSQSQILDTMSTSGIKE